MAILTQERERATGLTHVHMGAPDSVSSAARTVCGWHFGHREHARSRGTWEDVTCRKCHTAEARSPPAWAGSGVSARGGGGPLPAICANGGAPHAHGTSGTFGEDQVMMKVGVHPAFPPNPP